MPSGWQNHNTSERERKIIQEITRDSYNASKSSRKKRRRLEPVNHSVHLLELPLEMLRKILIYSGNLQLVFTCKQLLASLKPSFYLHAGLVREAMGHKGLDKDALMWPFVDPELLKELNITTFENTVIPYELEVSERLVSLELVAYMIACGCFAGEPVKLYERFIDQRMGSSILELLKRGQLPTVDNVVGAFEHGLSEAQQMLEALEVESLGDKQLNLLWTAAQGDAIALEYLESLL